MPNSFFLLNRLKKEYQIKIREINQLNDEKKTMQMTISRLNKKVQSLKARNNSKTDNEEGSKNNKIKIEMERIKWKDKGEMMLKLKDLPSNLEFKNSFLKKKYLSKWSWSNSPLAVLNNITDYGTVLFAQNLVTSEKDDSVKQEAINLISSQYVAFKSFSECLNTLFSRVLKCTKSRTLKDLCMNVSKHFKDVLNFNELKLWLVDEVLSHFPF